ncbi:helix-turn-helix domain-containing protein [[Actinomadura] parvosata]|uniref:helix-turn-helix domain-containing protein n=1 Tax=[Actinomadura] parvosata TaxID=1955412 RepID=UPI00406CDF45
MQEFSGDQLRRYMKARGFSVADFADAIGRSTVSVYGYVEGHKRPSLEIVLVMAERLSISLGDLFTETGFENAVSEFCRNIVRTGLDTLATPGGREEGQLLDEGMARAGLLVHRVESAPCESKGKIVRAAIERLREFDPELVEWTQSELGLPKDTA